MRKQKPGLTVGCLRKKMGPTAVIQAEEKSTKEGVRQKEKKLKLDGKPRRNIEEDTELHST